MNCVICLDYQLYVIALCYPLGLIQSHFPLPVKQAVGFSGCHGYLSLAMSLDGIILHVFLGLDIIQKLMKET